MYKNEFNKQKSEKSNHRKHISERKRENETKEKSESKIMGGRSVRGISVKEKVFRGERCTLLDQ